jgi:hypothetical protein
MVGSEQNASHRLDGWVEVGSVGDIEREDVKRFDHGGGTFAIYARPTASTARPTASARMNMRISPTGR